MIGFFGHNLEELAPPDTSAQYRDPRAGSVPSPYGPGSPLIPAQAGGLSKAVRDVRYAALDF